MNKKIKFPLLEFCAHSLHEVIAYKEHIAFCDQIEAYKTEGGNVVLGIMLQDRLKKDFQESLEKASEYISKANAWYVCDIIGERVFGYSLLHDPIRTIPEIKKRMQHPSFWVVRSLGAGIHYAIKKGLDQSYVQTVFPLLLQKANNENKEIRQGIGWAAKTTAKFHPHIIQKHQTEIQNVGKTANWFRKKIDIGLKRNNHA